MGNQCCSIGDPEKKRKTDLDLRGVSVHHLANYFMDLVRAKYPDSAERIDAQRKINEALERNDLLEAYKNNDTIKLNKGKSEMRRQDEKEFEYISGLFNNLRKLPKSEDTTIYQIEDLRELETNGIIREEGKDTICPIDGEKGAAYVHTLQGDDHVGPASIMISYTWGYSIGDIVDVLTNYCESNNLNPKEVYVWICCLCVNQHRVVELKKRKEEIPFAEFRKVFHGRVTSIGHVVAMMSPWTGPEYLTRVWCIFELFTASMMEDCKITIEMPEREREDFLEGLAKEVNLLNYLFLFFTSSYLCIHNFDFSFFFKRRIETRRQAFQCTFIYGCRISRGLCSV